MGRKSCKWFRFFCACRPMIYLQFLLFVSHILFWGYFNHLADMVQRKDKRRKVIERKKSCFEKSLLAVFRLFLVFFYHKIINFNVCKYIHESQKLAEQILYIIHSKVHSFLKQSFAPSSVDTIWGVISADFQGNLS